MRIILTGDIADWGIGNFSVSDIPEHYQNILKNADLCIYNMEGPIAAVEDGNGFIISQNIIRDTFWKTVMKVFKKKQWIVNSTARILEFKNLNPNLLFCLANNHVKDLGTEGLRRTLETLEDHSIPHMGAGWNRTEANTPYIQEIQGKQVIVINTNMVGLKKNGIFANIYGATRRGYGAGYISYKRLPQYVHSLRSRHPDALIIASIHDGRDAAQSVAATEIPVDTLRAIRENGADIVVTHHSHYANEIDEDGIFFLGDLVFKRPDPQEQSRPGSFLEVNVEGQAVNTTLHRYTFNGGVPKEPHQEQ